MRLLSVKDLKEKNFKIIQFSPEWAEKYGNPEKGFSALFYGPSGSGKSVEALKLADYIADTHGKVLYNSCEERISKSLQERVQEHGIGSQRLYFGDNMTFEELMAKLEKGRFAAVFIDSLQYMNFTYDQYKQFKKRYPSVALVFISQVNNRGTVNGGEKFIHAVDIKVNIVAGLAEIRSRFLQKGHVKVRLFGKEKQPAQTSLFNQ